MVHTCEVRKVCWRHASKQGTRNRGEDSLLGAYVSAARVVEGAAADSFWFEGFGRVDRWAGGNEVREHWERVDGKADEGEEKGSTGGSNFEEGGGHVDGGGSEIKMLGWRIDK